MAHSSTVYTEFLLFIRIDCLTLKFGMNKAALQISAMRFMWQSYL